jgi:hypothetical protein
MVLLNDFSFLKINGFEKPKCWKDVDKPGPSTVIHDSGEGNDRPMCKLGVRGIPDILEDHMSFLQDS